MAIIEKHPQIDEFALATGAISDGSCKGPNRCLGKREQIASGRVCGWRVLASAILLSGIRRALGEPMPYSYTMSYEGHNTVEAARQFVLSGWALDLAEYAGLDFDMFEEHRARWAAEWAIEAEERRAETAQHEGLPVSLLPRNAAIWGRP